MTTKMGRYRYWGDQKPDTSRPLLTLTKAADRVAVVRRADAVTQGEGVEQTFTGSIGTLRVYGPIDSWGGWWGVSAKDVAAALDQLGDVDTLIVRINSPGGESFEGRAIMNMLRAHAAETIGVVDGLAASAASYIAVGCDQTVMAPGTELMIHDTHVIVYGDAAALRKAADTADSISRSGSELYADVAGGTAEQWRQKQRDETWFTAAEAVAAGLAQRVGIVPDAGPVETSGETDDAGFEGDLDDRCDAEYDLSIFAHAGREHAPEPLAAPGGPKTPERTSAVGSTESHEGSPTVPLIDTMRTKLGLAEDADEAAVEAAIEKRLGEKPAESNEVKVPEGHTTISEAALTDLRANAEAGARAARELHEQRREAFLEDNKGKFVPANRDAWAKEYDRDAEATRKHFEGAPVIVSTEELGHSEDTTESEDVTESPAYQNWSM